MFLLGIGSGRSKRLILDHIFGGITALLLTSAVAHAGDLNKDLIKAAGKGNERKVLALLQKGADIDHQANNAFTALIIASHQGHEGVVKTLLAKDAEIDHQAQNGTTALIAASLTGHEGIVQALLAKGANVELRENGGGTALRYAKT